MSIPISPSFDSAEDNQEKVVEHQPETTRNATRKKWLSFAFRLVCTIVIFFFLFRSVSWSSLLEKIRHLDDGELLMGLVVGFSGVLISSYQWQSLLDAEKIRIDLRKLINFYLVGIAFSHFLPTGMGGDVVKAYYVGQEGKNVAGSASAVVMSRVTGLFGMLLVSLPALIIWHSSFSNQVIVSFLLFSLAICAAIGGAVFLVTLLPRFVKGKWAEHRLLSPVFKIGKALSRSASRPQSMAIAVGYGFLFHLAACLNYYSYGVVLHLNVPYTFYLVAIPFVSLIAFLPVSINGFGLRESAFVFIFSTIHVAVTTSLLLAFLVDIQTLLFGAIGGCIYLLMDRRKVVTETTIQDVVEATSATSATTA